MWPKQFWSVQNDLVLTIMKWSQPKWIVQVKMCYILVENHNLDLTNSFWSWPFHFGRDHFILVMTKSLWSSPNQFGQTKTILDRPKLCYLHRRTRQKWVQWPCTYCLKTLRCREILQLFSLVVKCVTCKSAVFCWQKITSADTHYKCLTKWILCIDFW